MPLKNNNVLSFGVDRRLPGTAKCFFFSSSSYNEIVQCMVYHGLVCLQNDMLTWMAARAV